jgi:hypothetical protein
MSRKVRPIRIDGNVAYVTLTQGCESIIDAADAEFVGRWNWCVIVDGPRRYAISGSAAFKEIKASRLHRAILGVTGSEIVDHIDGNGLNNRRQNLRIVSPSENAQNARARKGTESGYKGVFFHKKNNNWRAQIMANGKRYSLGLFNTPEEAHAAYCEASDRLHGEFGRTR